ncbi:MAG: hypothetical protein ACLFM2_02570 [Halothece sp.]
MKTFISFANQNHQYNSTKYLNDLRYNLEKSLPSKKSSLQFESFLSSDYKYCVFAWTDEKQSILYQDQSGCGLLIGYARRERSLLSCSDIYKDVIHLEDRINYFRDLGGVYTYFLYDERSKNFAVYNTPGRLYPLYYGKDKETIACGNRAMMVNALLRGEQRIADVKLDQRFPFFLLNGYYGDHLTPFSGVKVLESDTELIMNFGKISKSSISNLQFHDDGQVYVDPELYDQLASTLVDTVFAIGSQNSSLTLGLTGGKDSRLLFSAFLNSGLFFKCVTNGYSEHPDVLLAQRIAQYYNIEHELKTPGGKGESSTTIQRKVVSDIAESIFMTEGMLHPWKTICLPRDNMSNSSTVSGFGGEILRGGFAKSHYGEESLNRDQKWLSNFFLSKFYKNYEMLTQNARHNLDNWRETVLSSALSYDSPAAFADAFYLEFRAGRWAAMSLSSGDETYYPFCDAELIRISNKATVTTRVNDVLIVEMLKRLAPSLLTFPLADDQWAFWNSENTTYKPSTQSQPVPPLSTNRFTRAKVDWRLAVGTDLYNVFWEICCGSSADERLNLLVDRSQLQKVFKDGSIFKGSIAKFLWNVAGMMMVLKDMRAEVNYNDDEKISIRVDYSWQQIHWRMSKRIEKKLLTLLTNKIASNATIELIWKKIINPIMLKTREAYNLDIEPLRNHLRRYSLKTCIANDQVWISGESLINKNMFKSQWKKFVNNKSESEIGTLIIQLLYSPPENSN